MNHTFLVAIGAYILGALTWYSICSIKSSKEVTLCTYPGAEPCDKECDECQFVKKIEV